jgi:protein phosphatase 1L
MMFDMDGFSSAYETNSQPTRRPDLFNRSAKSESDSIWESGSCTVLGKRTTNEDRLQCQDNIRSSTDKLGYFAVYDGHSGDDAAVYLQQNLHVEITQHPLFEDDIIRAIEETCYAIDDRFIEICHQKKKEPGSTAVGVFLRRDELILFNIGDSCAVLCTNGAVEEIMQVHKPNRPDERERINKANGWITEEK